MIPNQQIKVITTKSSDPSLDQTALCVTSVVLGSGMFGCVVFGYEQKDPSKMYAVKVMNRKKIEADKQAYHQLQREISLMMKIKSPNVVSLRTFTKTENTYYLQMELLNGGDLQNYIKQRGKFLCEQEARLILRQIIKGLIACNKENVMHRDLKLSNIMVHFKNLR